MTFDEALEVAVRAGEGGAFRDLRMAWAEAEEDDDEADALVRATVDLVGPFPPRELAQLAWAATNGEPVLPSLLAGFFEAEGLLLSLLRRAELVVGRPVSR